MNDNTIGKGQIRKCRYQVTLVGKQATIVLRGYGLKGMTAGYKLEHKMASDGQLDRRDAAKIADIMLDLIKRIEALARMITAWGVNAETGVPMLTPKTQNQLRRSGSSVKNRNPLEKLMTKV